MSDGSEKTESKEKIKMLRNSVTAFEKKLREPKANIQAMNVVVEMPELTREK